VSPQARLPADRKFKKSPSFIRTGTFLEERKVGEVEAPEIAIGKMDALPSYRHNNDVVPTTRPA
jgi:hypothetical protein